jgi:hypothetical protein
MKSNHAHFHIFNHDHIDNLIASFSDCGWNMRKSRAQFHWPDIIFSDKILKIKNSEYDIELLGSYSPRFGGWVKEGQITLYYDKIEDVVLEYLQKELKIKSNDELYEIELVKNTKYLTSIVLHHEFVHWIMHWCESPRLGDNKFLSRKFIPMKYNEEDNINFHEGFAQLFTFIFCSEPGNEGLLKLFLWLETSQSECYKKYTVLYSKQNTYKKAICLLTFLREIGCQSFIAADEFNFDFSELASRSDFIDYGVFRSNPNNDPFINPLNRSKIETIIPYIKKVAPVLSDLKRGHFSGIRFGI